VIQFYIFLKDKKMRHLDIEIYQDNKLIYI